MPVWCPKCNAMLPDGTQQCPACGAKISNSSPGTGIGKDELRSIGLYIFGIALIPIVLAIILGILCLVLSRLSGG